MDYQIAGKVALIAAGASGTGLEVAEKLAAEGVRIILTSRKQASVDAAVARIEAAGGEVVGLVTDMTSPEGIARIAKTAEETIGMPDILVINPPSPDRARGLMNIEDAEYLASFEQYVLCVVRLARAFVPTMAERNWGRVVYLGSANMKAPNSIDPSYAQNIRVAAAALMKTLTYEFSRHQITFNTLAIGAFHTEVAKAYLEEAPEGSYEAFAQKVPMKRWGEVSELADVAVFLCSQAAGYLNGEVIRVDGGQIESMF